MGFRRTHCQWMAALVLAIAIQASLKKVNLGFTTSMFLYLLMIIVYGCQCQFLWGPDGTPPASFLQQEQGRQIILTESTNDVDVDEREERCVDDPEAPEQPRAEAATTATTATTFGPRYDYLDNLKVFLTAWVVTFHVACAFGAGGWMVIVGNYDNPCRTYFLRPFTTFSQAFFMPLFFFVSGFFVPSSLKRKGKKAFIQDKARRLLIPGLLATLIIMPASFGFAQILGDAPFQYIPVPGHAWYIFWLLVFIWAYVTCRQDSSMDEGSEATLKPFPGWAWRCFYGLFVCGFTTLAVIILVSDTTLWGMPLVHGSIGCDILLFAAGVCARENKWLEPSLPVRRPAVLFASALLEGGLCVWSGSIMAEGNISLGIGLLFFASAGMLCVDACTAMVHLFQRYATVPTHRMLVESAYTVYIIHPIVVTATMALFVQCYRSLYGQQTIQFYFKDASARSATELLGPHNGGMHILVGFIAVSIVSHCICWPLAWCLCHLPGLRRCLL